MVGGKMNRSLEAPENKEWLTTGMTFLIQKG